MEWPRSLSSMAKITERQATSILRRLHWSEGELARWAGIYLRQLAEERNLTTIEASDLIENLINIETQKYGWQYDEIEKRQREIWIKSIHNLLLERYSQDDRQVCSRCERKVSAWTEEDEFITCLKCREILTNKV